MNKDFNKEPAQILLTHLLTPRSGQTSFERSPLTPFLLGICLFVCFLFSTFILYTVAYHLLHWKHDKNEHLYFVFMLTSLQIGTGASDRCSH